MAETDGGSSVFNISNFITDQKHVIGDLEQKNLLSVFIPKNIRYFFETVFKIWVYFSSGSVWTLDNTDIIIYLFHMLIDLTWSIYI